MEEVATPLDGGAYLAHAASRPAVATLGPPERISKPRSPERGPETPPGPRSSVKSAVSAAPVLAAPAQERHPGPGRHTPASTSRGSSATEPPWRPVTGAVSDEVLRGGHTPRKSAGLSESPTKLLPGGTIARQADPEARIRDRPLEMPGTCHRTYINAMGGKTMPAAIKALCL